jgi:hypothetical protein
LEVIGAGVLLDSFPSKVVFDHCVRWAKQNNVFMWSKPWESGGLLFVTNGACIYKLFAFWILNLLTTAFELTKHLDTLDLE